MTALAVAGTREPLDFAPAHLVVAGYTGRDETAVRQHIDELAAIGIAAPPRIPMRYDLDPALLTVESVIAVPGAATSGEVEPVLLRHHGRWYLGVGSDHTDRELERVDIAKSKAACPKALGPEVVPLPDGLADGSFDTAWDAGSAECSVDGVRYQAGSLRTLRRPSDLLARLGDLMAEVGADDLAIFAGTLPLIDGTFRHGRDWTLTLRAAGHIVTHRYQTS